ncbi:MAG: substrate-binding domain-containing protein, partial [Armatimonadetes bacterium]|nr:substrate-binding domain-containing protein [Armatimonadota bacterium]
MHSWEPGTLLPTVVLTVRDGSYVGRRADQPGVACLTTADLRWGRCDIKSLNLLPNCLAKQQAQIENYIVQRVDAIIACPVDSRGIAPAVEKARAAGIPVFTADIAAQGAPVVSHIATDNYAGGKLAGEYLARLLD